MASKKGKIFYRKAHKQLVVVMSDSKMDDPDRCTYDSTSFEVMHFMQYNPYSKNIPWMYSDRYCNFDPEDPEDPFVSYEDDPKLVGEVMHESISAIFEDYYK